MSQKLAALILLIFLAPLPAQTSQTLILGRGSILETSWHPLSNLTAIRAARGVWLYDGKTLADVGLVCEGLNSFRLEWSLDGTHLACAAGNSIGIWDRGTGREQSILPAEQKWID